MKDMFIYRIIERCGTKRRFRKRHEDFFEKNIQLVLHEFAKMKQEIYYFEKIEDIKYSSGLLYVRAEYSKRCIFCDQSGNVICEKVLKPNDFKRDREKKK